MTKTPDAGTPRTRASAALWAYAYQMEPPQTEAGMELVRALLDQENGEARHGAPRWNARLVVERRVTHVLIVSDSPELSHEGNRKLEAELKAAGVDFSVTVPMLVAGAVRP